MVRCAIEARWKQNQMEKKPARVYTIPSEKKTGGNEKRRQRKTFKKNEEAVGTQVVSVLGSHGKVNSLWCEMFGAFV